MKLYNAIYMWEVYAYFFCHQHELLHVNEIRDTYFRRYKCCRRSTKYHMCVCAIYCKRFTLLKNILPSFFIHVRFYIQNVVIFYCKLYLQTHFYIYKNLIHGIQGEPLWIHKCCMLCMWATHNFIENPKTFMMDMGCAN